MPPLFPLVRHIGGLGLSPNSEYYVKQAVIHKAKVVYYNMYIVHDSLQCTLQRYLLRCNCQHPGICSIISSLLFKAYLRRWKTVMFSPFCLSICPSECLSCSHSKSYERCLVKFFGGVGRGPWNNRLAFSAMQIREFFKRQRISRLYKSFLFARWQHWSRRRFNYCYCYCIVFYSDCYGAFSKVSCIMCNLLLQRQEPRRQ